MEQNSKNNAHNDEITNLKKSLNSALPKADEDDEEKIFNPNEFTKNDYPTELEDLLAVLETSNNFEQRIDNMIEAVEDPEMGAPILEQNLLLFISGILKKVKNKRDTHIRNLHMRRKKMEDRAKGMAMFLALQSINMLKSINERLEGKGTTAKKEPKMELKAQRQLRRTLKRWAVYELYKVMNPRRIAGETRLDNFVHNAIVKGVAEAVKYDKEMEPQIENNKELKKEINNKHREFKALVNKDKNKAFIRSL